MQGGEPDRDVAPPRDYIGVARRLWFPILLILVVVPAATVALSHTQEARYRASADVLLTYQSLAASLTGISTGSGISQDPERVAETRARIARTPAVADRALRSAGGQGRTVAELLSRSTVRADPKADFLVFSVEDPQAAVATRLATAYARAFTEFSAELDTAAIERARQGVASQIRQLEERGDRRSDLYESLVAKEGQLGELKALQTSNASVVRPADWAERIRPRPLVNGVLALALAVVLAGCLVLVSEAFDKRVRAAEDAGEWLGLLLLGRLPEPPSRLRRSNRLVMLAEPNGIHAELLRLFKTSFEGIVFAKNVQAVMVTSAVRHEGKSTIVANLAVALARAGRRVALVDLDLRQPVLHRFFDVSREWGLTDVVLGRIPLDDAIVSMALPRRAPDELDDDEEAGEGDRTGGSATWPRVSPSPEQPNRDTEGALEILPAGQAAGDVSELVGTAAFSALLEQLRSRADLVLFDTPPLLQASEALALTRKVDGVVVVVRSNTTRRATLAELGRVLDNCPAAKLGFVFAGVTVEEAYGAGPHYHRSPIPARREPVK
jgi:polysaccharide biosynthesis transport protein